MALDLGDVVAGYQARGVLGRGGDSWVYLVENLELGRLEAMKCARRDEREGAAGNAERRLLHEFDIASMLDHPNVVSMYATGRVRGSVWLTMQYVDGYSAESLVPAVRKPAQVREILAVLAQIADALDYVHRSGVVHSDVKPSNVLIERATGLAVLTDFGIARTTDKLAPRGPHGRAVGSMPYAAPEVWSGESPQAKSDMYALACTVTELLTGKPPYPMENVIALANAHVNLDPPALTERSPWIPSSVDAFVAKAMAKNPDDRYDTCHEFVEHVTDAIRWADAAPRPRRLSRWQQWAQQRKWTDK